MRRCATFASLFLLALPALACRDSSDCRKPGTRCVKSHPYNYCGPWEAKDGYQQAKWRCVPR